jgi:hypothetical protein
MMAAQSVSPVFVAKWQCTLQEDANQEARGGLFRLQDRFVFDEDFDLGKEMPKGEKIEGPKKIEGTIK